MPALFSQLVKVRSHLAASLIAYLKAQEVALAESPLLTPFGMSLGDIRIPLKVMPFEPVKDIQAIRDREHFRVTGAGPSEGQQEDFERRHYRFRGGRNEFEQERRQSHDLPVALDDLEKQLHVGVILADPGGGKTEWLKHLALRAARASRALIEGQRTDIDDKEVVFPIFVRLPDVRKALDNPSDLRQLVRSISPEDLPAVLTDSQYFAAAVLMVLMQSGGVSQVIGIPAESEPVASKQNTSANLPIVVARRVWSWLNRPDRDLGRQKVLLCLDAWDEVREGQKELSRFLRAFKIEDCARIFLTSRVMGYAGSRPFYFRDVEDGPRRELQVCPFGWSDTDKFIRDFFSISDTARGERLIAELRAKPAVAGMAQNPLLSTLLCLAYLFSSREQKRLEFPARRVELYECVIRGLLGEWRAEADRDPIEGGSDVIKEKLKLLEALAFEVFPAEEVTADKWSEFVEAYMAQLSDTNALKLCIMKSRRTILQELYNDGILVPCGPAHSRSTLFLHLTFQEFLVAYKLASIIDDSKKGWECRLTDKRPDGACTVRELLDRKSWHPAWQEVIVMLAEMLPDPSPLLVQLSDEKHDDLFRHRLSLAGLCLAAARNTDGTGHNQSVTGPGKGSGDGDRSGEGSRVQPVAPLWRRRMRSLIQRAESALVYKPMTASLGMKQDDFVSVSASIACVWQQAADTRAEIFSHVRSAAAALARTGDELILNQLIHAFRHGSPKSVVAALQVLESQGPYTDRLGALVGAAVSSTSKRGYDVARALIAMGPHLLENQAFHNQLTESVGRFKSFNEPLLEVLGHFFREFWQDGQVVVSPKYLEGDYSLADIELKGFTLRQIVRAALGISEGWGRETASTILISLGGQSLRQLGILDELLGHLRKHPPDLSRFGSHSEIRRNVIYILSGLGRDTLAVAWIVPELLFALQHDPNGGVRAAAASSLGALGSFVSTDATVIPILLSIASKEIVGEWQVERPDALAALGHLCVHNVALIDHVLSLILTSLSIEQMKEAIEDTVRSLKSHAAEKTGFLQALLSALRGDRGIIARISAIRAFVALGDSGPRDIVIARLIDMLNSENRIICEEAAQALGEMGGMVLSNRNLLPSLLRILQTQEREVKSACLETIGKLGKGVLECAGVVQILLEFIHSHVHGNERVRYGESLPKRWYVYLDRGFPMRPEALRTIARLSPHVLRDDRVVKTLLSFFEERLDGGDFDGSYPAASAIATLSDLVVNYSNIVEFLVGDYPSKPLTPAREDAVRRFLRQGIRFFRQGNRVFAKTVAQLSE
jgi:HEAT repeat protein